MTTPIMRIKITPAPKLRGKMDVRFPANVEALAPILLDKSGGTFTFSLDFTQLSASFATAAQGAKADTAVQSIVAGSNVTVDNTDPRNPVVSSSGGGGGGSGDVTGPSSSVDGEIALFNSTTGKVIKRASTTGILKASSGVLSAATAGADYYNPGGTDVAITDGGTGASTAAGARTNLGSTTVGDAVFVAANAAAARTAIGAGTISTQDSSNVSITGGSVTGITDLAIADGGTGQSTATAGFNALSPTTTRGDIIVRGASNNQRLALGTSGYFVGSDGTDVVWKGFLQSGTGASTRTWNAKASEIFSVKDFGAVGNGSTDDTSAVQAALDAIKTAGGGTLFFPSGTYKITGTGLSYNISAVANRFTSRLRIVGDGAGASVLSFVALAATAFTYTGNASYVESYLRFENIRITGDNTVGSKGISISIAAYVSSENLVVEAFDYNIDCTDVEQSQFSNSFFKWGLHGARFNASVSATSANSINFLNTHIASNTTWGLSITNGNAINYIGGSIQYNGATGGGSGQWGAKFIECGNGYGTVSLLGVSIEGNGGLGDIISDQTTNPAAFNIAGCGFVRPSSSSYATNCLTLLGSNASTTYSLTANKFAGFGTYSANAGRPYIGITNTSAYIVDDGSNIYGSATEQPSWAGSATFGSKNVIAGSIKAAANSAIGGSAGNSILNVIVPNNAGTSNAIRFIDDGAASRSTSNNSYGVGVNPSTGAFVFTAGSAGSYQMFTANTQRFALDNAGNAIFSGGNLSTAGAFSSSAPVTKTGTSSTVGANDSSIIYNASGTHTTTLPSAASYSGRWLHVKSIAAQTINSASSNVVPRNSATAGTALLASGAGNWAFLQSDGTNWVVMAGN